MPIIAIALVSFAAIIHAFWNLLGKRQNPSAAFFMVAALTGGLALLPLVAGNRHVLPLIPASIWALIGFSCLSEAVYYSALAGAYRNGDMSLAYPLARALPTIFITVVAVVLGTGEPIMPPALVGIALVAAGCLMLPLRNRRSLRLADYLSPCCLLAIVAAVGTTGYTTVDNEALRLLRSGPGSSLAGVELTLVYLGLTSLGSALCMAVYVALWGPERARLSVLARNGVRYAVLAGAVITIGYGMVLMAMAYAANVSYIGAFRQISIPLGAALGIVVEREPLYPAKVVGTAVVLVGLVLVALA